MISAILSLAAPSYLDYRPAPADNPLKGLVPYQGDWKGSFPHSMEFNYVPLSALVKGEKKYDWTKLEELLLDISGRGHQTIFRVYLEYPGHKDVIPSYLLDKGVKVERYVHADSKPESPTYVETPDYKNPDLRACLKDFIAAMGAKYDKDPRIGFISAGLLGTWGEWHTWPRNDLWAPKAVQTEVLDAYETAFKTTPILLRYPHGPNSDGEAQNAHRPFGYHDDSFAFATLDTKRPDDSWFFMSALGRAGEQALNKWKSHPIGGEIRPEVWGKIFDDKPNVDGYQDFAECVKATRVSWLMDSGMFGSPVLAARKANAIRQVQRMGYEIHAVRASIKKQSVGYKASVAVTNRGIAPFYADWKAKVALLTAEGKVVSTVSAGSLKLLQPGSDPTVWTATLPQAKEKAKFWAVSVPNPMPKGHPVKFANVGQDYHADGWLTLGELP